MGDAALPSVSVITPVHNGRAHIDAALASVVAQTYRGALEISVVDDGSTDGSLAAVEAWRARLAARGVALVVGRNERGRGAGPARNQAVAASSGEVLCLLDCDDVMRPERIEAQVAALLARGAEGDRVIIGSKVERIPAGSTQRYVDWLNSMTQSELVTRRFNELTVICPTWLMSRAHFERLGGFPDDTCEDLRVFFHNFAIGGTVARVDLVLLEYRWHTSSLSFSDSNRRKALVQVRARAFENQILSQPRWRRFSIWSYGRDGRALFNSLSVPAKRKVAAFCDVDTSKVGNSHFDDAARHRVPIIAIDALEPPFVTCVMADRFPQFAQRLAEVVEAGGLVEGVDYFRFC